MIGLIKTLDLLANNCRKQAIDCERKKEEMESFDGEEMSWYYTMKMDNIFFRGMQAELVKQFNSWKSWRSAQDAAPRSVDHDTMTDNRRSLESQGNRRSLAGRCMPSGDTATTALHV